MYVAADDLGHFPPICVVANRPVNRLVLADIKFWLVTKQGRKTGLRIEVDRQHAISAKREILREMRGGRGFAATAFEVHHRDDLQGLAVFPMRNITSHTFAAAIEFDAKCVDVLDRVGPTIIRLSGRPLPFRYELTQIPFVDANELGRLGRGKSTNGLLCRRREIPQLLGSKAHR